MIDPNGYLPIAPLDAKVISARASSGTQTEAAVAQSAAIPKGSVATLIAIGSNAGGAMPAPALLLCIDNQPSGGILSDCSVAR